MNQEMENKIRNCIMEITQNEEALRIGAEENTEGLGMNSVNIIKLIVELENIFAIEFDDEDLDYNKLKTLKDLMEYIEIKMKHKNQEEI